jgi:hypothetical protein
MFVNFKQLNGVEINWGELKCIGDNYLVCNPASCGNFDDCTVCKYAYKGIICSKRDMLTLNLTAVG